jgi:alpha-L-rhamnosidase
MLTLCTTPFLLPGSSIQAAESFSVELVSPSAGATESAFQTAKPVWPQGRETEMNLFVGFRVAFGAPAAKPVVLRVAAATLYRLYVNGEFSGYGPARGPHGFFRVDEWDITPHLSPVNNLVAIEVAGYNINSFYVLNQQSFLQAEITAGTQVIAASGNPSKPFAAKILSHRVQKVERYSFQRAFTEVYHLQPGVDAWRSDPNQPFPAEPCSVSADKQLIRRRVSYPRFERRQPERRILEGSLSTNVHVEKLWKPRFMTGIGPHLLGFTGQELAEVPSFEMQRVANNKVTQLEQPYVWASEFPLSTNRFHLFDFGTDLTGFIGARVTARTKTRLYLTFDETLVNGDIDFKRLDTVNILAYQLEPGAYNLESMEPYTLRFLKFLALEGDCDISQIQLREYVNPDVWAAHFDCSDQGLNLLFAAGRQTFRQNSVDLFMDCPSRERAGWLCDSYFTSRVEHRLSGASKVEDTFFENYLLPQSFAHIPEGMLPMCYPADQYDGQFIPNWAMWFVLQLQEYAGRSGNTAMVAALRPKVTKLFDYFRAFQNEDGLLEKLKSWVFIEWSAANNYTQDVNYPTNMLYAAALEAAGKMYGMPAWVEQAAAIRKVIRRQSYDGHFFVDNAIRKSGKLVPTRNRTETCQYYAFYLGAATPETFGSLWNVLVRDFGPARKQTGLFPDIAASNAFIGNVLRLELLSRYGSCQQLIGESRAYLLYMAERTGTLWENVDARASLDHGFASHIVNVLYRDVLGLYQIDWVNKKADVRFTDAALESCEGRVPVPEGAVSMRWRKESGKLFYQLDVPAGYTVNIENRSALPLEMMGRGNDRQPA